MVSGQGKAKVSFDQKMSNIKFEKQSKKIAFFSFVKNREMLPIISVGFSLKIQTLFLKSQSQKSLISNFFFSLYLKSELSRYNRTSSSESLIIICIRRQFFTCFYRYPTIHRRKSSPQSL